MTAARCSLVRTGNSRLVRPHPHVAVDLPVGSPCQRFLERSSEHGSEVADLGARHVADQTQEIRRCGHERSPDVVLRQPLEFPQHHVSGGLQVLVPDRLRVQSHNDQHRAASQDGRGPPTPRQAATYRRLTAAPDCVHVVGATHRRPIVAQPVDRHDQEGMLRRRRDGCG